MDRVYSYNSIDENDGAFLSDEEYNDMNLFYGSKFMVWDSVSELFVTA